MAARGTATAPRPPRAMAWVLLLSAAVATLVIGLAGTFVILGNLRAWPRPDGSFWARFFGACALTLASVSLRSLRWIFLLRRSETRIPIRDAYIGYFAGFSLLFAPFLLGEIAVRAFVLRARGRVPFMTTAIVNLWERSVDLAALMTIAGIAAALSYQATFMAYGGLALVGLTFIPRVRRLAIGVAGAVVGTATRRLEGQVPKVFDRLASTGTWSTALATSIVIWLLPGIGFWLMAGEWDTSFSLTEAERAYASSTIGGSLVFAPGGIVVAGRQLLDSLAASGMPDAVAVMTVVGVRLATVGISVALGLVFVVVHMRSAAASSETHFDDIAEAYDVQIPGSRRDALLERKTGVMEEIIRARGVGLRGLDVGCGQGAYVRRMRERGFDVSGIDFSAGQVERAARNVGATDLVRVGSVLDIPAAGETFDFVYVINVLHHLGSIDEQRQAFREIFRVLKPGGLLFVHEINTTNVLFRFYMGYVFPSLNCIDEGVERWLLPDRLATYTDAAVVDVRYFTFLPEFVPAVVVRFLRPLERALEESSLRRYSAHYAAVLEKRPRIAR